VKNQTETLLEFQIEKLLGQPAQRCRNGESYWVCPLHNDTNPSFHTLPQHPDYRHFWKCMGCNRGGNIYQLLRELRNVGGFPMSAGGFAEHQALVREWDRQWAALTINGEEKPGSIISPLMLSHQSELLTDSDPTPGTKLLWHLIEEKRIDEYDLLAAHAEIRHRRLLNIEAVAARKWRRTPRGEEVSEASNCDNLTSTPKKPSDRPAIKTTALHPRGE